MAIKSMNGARGWACGQSYINFIFWIHSAKTYSSGFTDKPEMLEHFKSLTDDEKKSVIGEINQIKQISVDDLVNFVGVHESKNGGFITASTLNNYSYPEMMSMVVESIIECSKQTDSVFF